MDITPIDDEISKIKWIIKKENESLKKENELLRKEIKLLKEKNSDCKIKIDTLLPGDLLFKKGNSTDEYIIIEKGGIQYGPYFNYEQGKYLIIYNGENLLNAKFDVFDNWLQLFFVFKMKNKSETKVIYEVFISKNLSEGIEFRAHNNTNTFIFIKSIEVYKYNV